VSVKSGQIFITIILFGITIIPCQGQSTNPFYGYHFDSNNLEYNNIGNEVWTIFSIYGSPSEENPGPSAAHWDDEYSFCLNNGLSPIFRLEESWWSAKGMYLDHFAGDGTLNVALGDQIKTIAAPIGEYTWMSTDPAVATIDTNGTATAVGLGSCRIMATDLWGNSSFSSLIEVSSLVIRVKNYAVVGTYENFFSSGTNTPHLWSVSDDELADIDPETGEFHAKTHGTVTVTVTDSLNNTKSHSLEIIDTWIRGKLAGFNNKLAVGDTFEVNIEGELAGEIYWVYNPDLFQLEDNSGIFTAIAPGDTTIKLITDQGEYSNTIHITISEILISYPWKLQTIPDDSIQFSAHRINTSDFIWSVDNPSVGSIDQNGLFTALSPGSCHIIVSDGSHEVTSDPVEVNEILVINEYWRFFELWIQSWVQRFPSAWFQYGNEISAIQDSFKTIFSNVREGYVRAMQHAYEATKSITQRDCLIAQGACSVTIFDDLISYGLDSWVDAYALHTYFKTRDMNYSSIIDPDSSGSIDPDVWHETLMDHSGVSPDKFWFVTETSCRNNIQDAPTIDLLPTHFAYFNQFKSETDKQFKAAIWFNLHDLIDPGNTSVNDPWEGYYKLVEFVDRASSPPPLNITMIDLTDEYNCDGIASIDELEDGDFDGSGNKLAAEQLNCGSVSTTLVDRIPWNVPPCDPGQLNIIACSGQVIELPPTRSSKIHLIACGTAGSTPLPNFPRSSSGNASYGEFTMIYSDTGFSRISLCFSDWTSGPLFGEYPAALGRYYLTPDGPTREYNLEGDLEYDQGSFLWDYIIETDDEKVLKALILPDNQNIKIMAITLETSTANFPSIDIYTNKETYHPDDQFTLGCTVDGGITLSDAIVFVLLDIEGHYWCWPGWNTDPYENCGKTILIEFPETWNETLIDFTWPYNSGSGYGILFWSVLCNLKGDIVDFSWCEFDYTS